MTYTFVDRHPTDWHEAGQHGWLYSAAFVTLADEHMPHVAETIRFAYDEGLSVKQIVFSGPVIRLYLDFTDCSTSGRDAVRLGAEIFDDLHRRVPLRDVVFHDGVYDDGSVREGLDLVPAAEIYAPYGPQRPIGADAPPWATNETLKSILGF